MSNGSSHGSLVRDEKHPGDGQPVPQHQRPRSKKVLLFGASAALIIILALALGLGLGLGLKHHHSPSSSTSSSGNSNSSSNPSNLPLLQRTPPENFILGTIRGQPPQTRFYNFTVGEVWGAPDGVGKRMLVVNGTCSSVRQCSSYIERRNCGVVCLQGCTQDRLSKRTREIGSS